MFAISRRIINVYKGEFWDIIRAFLLGKAISGKSVQEFEEAFAEFIAVKNFYALSSGRASLKIILEAFEFPEGSEIIMPAYTAEEVPETVRNLGLTPVFVDIKPTDHTIDPNRIEGKITAKTKAIIPTHLFGFPCDMEAIAQLAQKHGLIIIEDCAHAIGAQYKNTPVGSFGHAAFFSFANSKPFNTLGGGGIAANDNLLAEKIALKVKNLSLPPLAIILKSTLVSFLIYLLTCPLIFSIFVYPFFLLSDLLGNKQDFIIRAYSRTFKKTLKSVRQARQFSNLQAIIGIKQLTAYKDYCTKTIVKTNILVTCLGKIRYLVTDIPDAKPVSYFFVIVNERRELLAKYLLWRGVDTGASLMRLCPKKFNDEEQYPVAEEALRNSFQVPLHQFVNEKSIIKIANAINQFSGNLKKQN